MNELQLFAGAGGGVLGGVLLGHRTVCAVEIDPYCRRVLLARQNDGILPPFPVFDDVRSFDGTKWRGIVDIVSGGFPCQDISCAGKGAGLEGKRSGLWSEFARIISEVRPKYAFVENSPMLTVRGLGVVLGDLAKMGYDARWCVLGATDAGAPHKRERIWILAHSDVYGRSYVRGNKLGDAQQCESSFSGEVLDNTNGERLQGTHEQPSKPVVRRNNMRPSSEHLSNTASIRQSRPGQSWYASDPAESLEGETGHAFYERVGHIWAIESPLGRVANGVANRMDRLKAIGNGQVPQVAALAWRTLAGERPRPFSTLQTHC